MRRILLLLFVSEILFSQILRNPPYEKYVDSTKIIFFWQTLSFGDTRVRIGKTPELELREIIDTTKTKTHEIVVDSLEPARVYYVQIASYGITKDSVRFVTSTSSGTRSTGQMNVYFNKGVDTTVSIGVKAQGNVNLKDKLIQRINQARYSIDICFYNLSTDQSGNVGHEIANALINAKSRGVKVRFIIDGSNSGNAPVTRLRNAGIPVLSRNDGNGIMHNKFAVFDFRDTSEWRNVWVWTGSWNASVPGTYSDYQNVVEIQDRALAQAFTLEFEEMWGGSGDFYDTSKSKFGSSKSDNTPHVFNINGKRVELYFSPSDKVASKIQNAISTADKTIFFALLTLTNSSFTSSLQAKANMGVTIKGILDNNTDSGSQYYNLRNFAEVLIDTDRTGLFHHKYCIIDPTHIYMAPVLVTGSYNWSNSAENTNDENVVIVYDDPILVNQYLQEFVARYKQNGGSTPITLVQEKSGSVEFSLSQNFPNPFNSQTKILYSIPVDGFVKIKIFDMLGREVGVVLDEFQRAGVYHLNLNFDSFNLSSGVYFYRLEFQGFDSFFAQTKKMLYIK